LKKFKPIKKTELKWKISEQEGAMDAQWYSQKFLAKTDKDQLQKKLTRTTENTQTAVATTTTKFLMYT
jgi:hypothetical protein